MPNAGRYIPDESVVSDTQLWLMYLRSQCRNVFSHEVRPSANLADLMRKHWPETDHSEVRHCARRTLSEVVAARQLQISRLGLRTVSNCGSGRLKSILSICHSSPRWRRQGRFVSMDLRYTDGSELAEETGVVDALDVPAWDMWVGIDELDDACKIVCWVPMDYKQQMQRAIQLCPARAIGWE